MNEQSIWQEIIEVRTYETDFQGVWKPAAFFRAMEEATVHHAAALNRLFNFTEIPSRLGFSTT